MADTPNEIPEEENTHSRQQAGDKAKEEAAKKARSVRGHDEGDDEPPRDRGAIASDSALKTDIAAVAW
ncbi:hypothetical protein [Streptomyces sp. NPDC053755]|uniref:hypothetical protein n=1 Tax=Streptomyces sp. NPDC053755 TaxID=3155815 RepID=UPI003433C68A